MSAVEENDRKVPSWKRIIGFACQQGFIYSLFYMGSNRGLAIADTVLERADLLLTLVFMCIAFLVLRKRMMRVLTSSLAPVFIITLSVLLIIGSLVPSLVNSVQAVSLVVEGIVVGISLAALYIAWGFALGTGSPRTIAVEIFAATGFAAAISFAFAFLPTVASIVAPNVCALAGAIILIICLREQDITVTSSTKVTSDEENASRSLLDLTSALFTSHSLRISTSTAKKAYEASAGRIVAGAAMFGVAAGFMEAYRSDPGMLVAPNFPSTLLILALFCIAVLQSLYVEKPTEGESLGSMYRIAMLVIMAGFLFTPILEDSGVPGEAIILAGNLGLVAVLMAFFLVIGRIVKADVVEEFVGGLTAIYLGEVVGIVAANIYDFFVPNEIYSYAIMAVAGLAILFSYLFLFTEQDFRAFSAVVDTTDTMEKVCKTITQRYGLSKRETEVMTLALRGRSNERIAQELFIAKSTADTHMRRIYGKCGISGRQELIDLAQHIAEEIHG